MHIPDGYLSPATCIVMYGAAVPFWYRASRRVKQAMSTRMVPVLSIFAAFTFVIQMFNLPIPGGTTAHAAGGTLVAIVLGPWAAVIGVSIALIIQAIFFGDGGITAIGANSFNLAIALPLAGYAVYRIACGSRPSPRRRAIAAAIGGYAGINVAALLTAIELGLQPVWWSEGGRALYNPYGLSTTVPAMLITHAAIVGFAEAALTALVVSYLLRAHPSLFEDSPLAVASRELGKIGWAMAVGLIVTAVLAPLGLLAPGVAEFEWSAEEISSRLGYAPSGLERIGSVWAAAPLSGYRLPWLGTEADFGGQAAGYVLSAVIGAGLIVVVMLVANAFYRLEQAKERHRDGGAGGSGRRRVGAARGDFLGKTVSGITEALERSIFSEEQARLDGVLQRIDPRVKLLALLGLVGVAGLSRQLWVIVAIYLLSLALAVVSKLSLGAFVRRALLGIPLFAGLVVLPSIFIVPGHPIVSLQLTEGFRLGISDNGLSGATMVIARVSASVSLGMLLVLTTRWTDLLQSLRALRLPQAFVLVLGMTYRYLFLVLRLTNDMFLARASRTVGQSTGGQNRRWVAATSGALIGKSLKMSDDVYLAMLARGFSGEVRTIHRFRTRNRDWLFAGAVLLFAAAALLLERGLS